MAFNDQIHGGVIFAQNTILTCDGVRDNGSRDDQGCHDAQAGIGPSQNNNLWRAAYVDADEDPDTFNSSSAPLMLPENATVVWVALYWGANTTANSGNPSIPSPEIGSILLCSPNNSQYTSLTAEPANIARVSSAYKARVDVADMVRAGGAGLYTVANLPAAIWPACRSLTGPIRPALAPCPLSELLFQRCGQRSQCC